MSDFYGDGARELQDRFETRRLADRIEERLMRDHIEESDQAFIERMDMFFLATVDRRGRPSCSYNGRALALRPERRLRHAGALVEAHGLGERCPARRRPGARRHSRIAQAVTFIRAAPFASRAQALAALGLSSAAMSALSIAALAR
jgi:hypothetical protein